MADSDGKQKDCHKCTHDREKKQGREVTTPHHLKDKTAQDSGYRPSHEP